FDTFDALLAARCLDERSLDEALVRIAHDADVPVLAGQLADDPVLGTVGVLVLVDEHVAPEAAVPGERLGDVLIELHGLQTQLVEVDGAGAAPPLPRAAR